jgi:endonuclease/exonuclease/phosphatase family metal-dependent hydrolase
LHKRWYITGGDALADGDIFVADGDMSRLAGGCGNLKADLLVGWACYHTGMRIVCWNIERGYRPSQIVAQLKHLNADIYLLYELDRGVKRTGGVDMFKIIGQGLGCSGQYVTEFLEVDSIWRRIIPWGGPGGGEIGNAIFSKHTLEEYSVLNLPLQKPLTYERTTLIPELFQPRKGCRKAQICTIPIDGIDIQIASAHLELWRGGWRHRKRQLDAILGHTKGDYTVVAGDFNSVQGAVTAMITGSPQKAEIHHLRTFLGRHGLVDPFADSDTTAGRLGVHAKLDWVAASESMVVSKAVVIPTGLSDHACLVVDYDTVSSSRSIGAS